MNAETLSLKGFSTVENVDLDVLVETLEVQKTAKFDIVAPAAKLGYFDNRLVIDGINSPFGEPFGEKFYGGSFCVFLRMRAF